jgi:hypothetical protein
VRCRGERKSAGAEDGGASIRLGAAAADENEVIDSTILKQQFTDAGNNREARVPLVTAGSRLERVDSALE